MKRSHRAGLGFGITSGIITTLGLMVGLYSGTHSIMVVIGGVLTIAVADAFADALGIHVSKESTNEYSSKEIWEATVTTFLTKFCVAISFLIPPLVFQLSTAVLICIIWGVLLLGSFSFYIAKKQNVSPWPVVFEHVLIACLVITLSHYLSHFIEALFI